MKKPCSVCGTPSYGPRCPKHAEAFAKTHVKSPDNSQIHKSGGGWARTRKAQLRRQPLCELCLSEGLTTQAQEIDHIIPRGQGGTDKPANLRSVCTRHHILLHKPKYRSQYTHEQRTDVGSDGPMVG